MLYSRSLLQDAIVYGIMIANGCRIFSFAEICLGRGWLVVRGSLINCCRLVRFQCVLLCQYKGFVFVTKPLQIGSTPLLPIMPAQRLCICD
jgi:hypothetical protein